MSLWRPPGQGAKALAQGGDMQRGEQKQNFFKIKKIITLVIITGLFLMPFISFSNAIAATPTKLNDLLQQKTKITSEISNNQKQVEKKKQEAITLNNVLKTINTNIDITQSKITDLQNQIEQTQRNIEETEGQIIQKEKELADQKNKKNETIRTMYEQNQDSALYIIVGSNTLSEAIDKVQYFETLENKIENTIEEVNKLKKDLEDKKSALGQKKSELSNIKSEQEAYRQGLNQQQQEKQIVLSDVNAQKKKLEEQIAEAKKMTAQVEAQIAQIQAQMKSNSSRTVMARDRGTSSVGFSWPINYNYLSAYYGEKTPFQSFHTGLDMVNIVGTPIYASTSGTVITATDMMTNGHYYGYGKYVVIGHNARYSSLYGHLMAYSVTAGQEVKTGDVIGYLGNTGWSTGPHLHFEIWDYGVRQNPLTFLP